FHLLLYRALGNPLVDNLIELFWELFTRLGDAIPVPPEGGRGAVHLRIIRALQDGDAEASIAAMRGHFDDIRVRAALLRHPESDAG
ncbi:MAG TPA: FCD domain-containing protein, partial [Pseudonocardia sp.]|nr:FCD domain-containing protein [Pseudonocardia sp.]